MNNTEILNIHTFIPQKKARNLQMSSSPLPLPLVSQSSQSSLSLLDTKSNYTEKNNKESEGYLELILGPMFSGKTSTLKKIYDQCTYCNIPVMVINYEADNRYCDASFMSTHDKIMIPCIKGTSILEIMTKNKEKVDESEVILINEGQFFADITHVISLVENLHKRVYICGLDGDFKKNKIGSLLDLIPYCDNVSKLKSLCSECRNGKAGLFSYRITNETNQVVIGVENYKPVCRACFNILSANKDDKHNDTHNENI
jgi:thymidine kinase